MKIAFIGIGRLGGALALALAQKNYDVRQLVSRRRENGRKIAELIAPPPEIFTPDELEKISADLIFITTPDAAIRTVAENLAARLKHRPTVFHTSGALSSEVLSALREKGCATASLHPLVSVSDAVSSSTARAERFRDVFFCVEGDDTAAAVGLAEEIAARLGGKSFSVPTQFKALYHAAAVTASGHLTALVSIAVEMLRACGLSAAEARKILLPLVASTVENLSAQTPAEALTGTFARADVETLRRHLAVLRRAVAPELLAVYLQLGRRSLHIAQRQGANAEKLAEMENLLNDAQAE